MLPDDPPKEGQKKWKKLAAIPRGDFDQRYMQMMVKEHEKALKETAQMVREVTDTEVRALAQRAHDLIGRHLRLAAQISPHQGAAAAGASPERK